jgi:hypothetical protein
MMKPRLLPIHLEDVPSETFVRQLGKLKELTSELVDWLEPAHIDRPVPAGAGGHPGEADGQRRGDRARGVVRWDRGVAPGAGNPLDPVACHGRLARGP